MNSDRTSTEQNVSQDHMFGSFTYQDNGAAGNENVDHPLVASADHTTNELFPEPPEEMHYSSGSEEAETYPNRILSDDDDANYSSQNPPATPPHYNIFDSSADSTHSSDSEDPDDLRSAVARRFSQPTVVSNGDEENTNGEKAGMNSKYFFSIDDWEEGTHSGPEDNATNVQVPPYDVAEDTWMQRKNLLLTCPINALRVVASSGECVPLQDTQVEALAQFRSRHLSGDENDDTQPSVFRFDEAQRQLLYVSPDDQEQPLPVTVDLGSSDAQQHHPDKIRHNDSTMSFPAISASEEAMSSSGFVPVAEMRRAEARIAQLEQLVYMLLDRTASLQETVDTLSVAQQEQRPLEQQVVSDEKQITSPERRIEEEDNIQQTSVMAREEKVEPEVTEATTAQQPPPTPTPATPPPLSPTRTRPAPGPAPAPAPAPTPAPAQRAPVPPAPAPAPAPEPAPAPAPARRRAPSHIRRAASAPAPVPAPVQRSASAPAADGYGGEDEATVGRKNKMSMIEQKPGFQPKPHHFNVTKRFKGSVSKLVSAVRAGAFTVAPGGVYIRSTSNSIRKGYDVYFHVTPGQCITFVTSRQFHQCPNCRRTFGTVEEVLEHAAGCLAETASAGGSRRATAPAKHLKTQIHRAIGSRRPTQIGARQKIKLKSPMHMIQKNKQRRIQKHKKEKAAKYGVHWESETDKCSLCRKAFTALDRRHHCRFCGKCICQQCSSRKYKNAASKKPERICDECYKNKTQPKPPKMFGIHIHNMDDKNGRTPYPMRRFLSWIQFLRENGLRTEGIFRKPGESFRIKAMRKLCESKETVDDSDLQDEVDKASVQVTVYLVASMLKMFLREMKGGLMPLSVCHVLRQHLRLEIKNDAPRPHLKWRSSFLHLSAARFQIITALFFFLHEVARHSDTNRMSASSLAVCFAPSIFEELKTPQPSGMNQQDPAETMRLLQQFREASETFNSIATLLIERAREIFT